MLKRLYDRLIEIAAGPNAMWALVAVSFAESSFFPIPGDVLMIPMMLARPRDAWRIAAVATLSSVAGGLLGYAIGYYAFDLIGKPILEFHHVMGTYDDFRAGFGKWGGLIIIIKGLTPIPYKLVTIASGVAHFDLLTFIGASIISRSIRFFFLAALLWWFGPVVRDFIEKRLMLVTTGFALCLVGGFVAIHYLLPG
jgi:membrane protein YqaA with SNARE-associated domain